MQIHPTSVLSNICPLYILYDELVQIDGVNYLMQVSAIEVAWIYETGYYLDEGAKKIEDQY
jgi:hypothetical protein